MTKIDIISGFLGAGKTTLIKKLLKECFSGEKVVLVENEFGEIGVDGAFLAEAGIQVNEINSGCICCSLKGDFSKALGQVMETYHPDRILIEPSGVGKLSDVIEAAKEGIGEEGVLNSFTTVADVTKAKMYAKNFGEFYRDQIVSAHTVILSRTGKAPAEKTETALSLIREMNPSATIITTPWNDLDGETLLSAMESHDDMMAALMAQVKEEHEHHHHEHHHHHDHECDDPDCSCHHHDHGHAHEHEHEHEHDHEHHHHDHECDDPDCSCHHHHDHDHEHDHEHDHHHEHDHECTDPHCSCHDHHHHDHHADEVFASFGVETAHAFTKEQIEDILDELDLGSCGMILRAKGVVPSDEGWLHFDFTPGEHEIRIGSADVIGRICVIGSNLKETAIRALFGI